MSKSVLVVMDYMNEIIHPQGKLSGKGYAKFQEEHKTLERVNQAIDYARSKDMEIVFVKLGFSQDYKEHNEESILIGSAKKFGALKLGTWATEFEQSLDFRKQDYVIVKHRMSPFYKTDLDSYLKNKGVSEVYLCGVATDLVVQSAARDAHDRDYKVIVLSDACTAASKEEHENALNNMAKFTSIKKIKNIT